MEDFLIALILIASILVLVLYFVAIQQFVDAAKEKGYYRDGAAVLWLLGIFGTPFLVGLIAAALPDKAGRAVPVAIPVAAAPKTVDDELPEV